jgi:DNA-binding transcriptional regulator YiaG
MTKSEISFVLRKYRSLHNLTQQELADRLGTRIEMICRWERCRFMPRGKWKRVMKERGIL